MPDGQNLSVKMKAVTGKSLICTAGGCSCCGCSTLLLLTVTGRRRSESPTQSAVTLTQLNISNVLLSTSDRAEGLKVQLLSGEDHKEEYFGVKSPFRTEA